jgi:lysozyme family protein
MAAWTYDEALRRVLAHEGGYSNHPADPGGPTKYGITIHDYRRYVKRDATAADVRAMSKDEAKAIYRRRYWDALRCDELPAGLDYSVFDYGVNSGIGRSGKVLRRLLGLPANAHTVTDEVLARVAARDPAEMIEALNAERLAFLKRLKTWPVFGAGWGRRVAEVKAASLAMAKRPAPTLPANTGTAAAPVPAKTPAMTAADPDASRLAVGGAAAAGAAAAQHALVSGARPLVLVAILAAAVTVVLAAWLVWRWRGGRAKADGTIPHPT